MLLTRLQQAAQLDWSRAVVDASSVRAVGAGKTQEANYHFPTLRDTTLLFSSGPDPLDERPEHMQSCDELEGRIFVNNAQAKAGGINTQVAWYILLGFSHRQLNSKGLTH